MQKIKSVRLQVIAVAHFLHDKGSMCASASRCSGIHAIMHFVKSVHFVNC